MTRFLFLITLLFSITTQASVIYGPAAAPPVTNISGYPVAGTAPTSGQVISWNSTSGQWEPADSSSAPGLKLRYTTNAGQSLTGGFTNDTIKFEDLDYDNSAGAYNPATGVFTAPATKCYEVHTTVTVNQGVSAGDIIIAALVDGSEVARGQRLTVVSTKVNGGHYSDVLCLTSGQTIAIALSAEQAAAVESYGPSNVLVIKEIAGGGSPFSLAAVGSAPSANGASISGSVLTLQPADATHPGLMTILTQSFAGAKTFTGSITGDGGDALSGFLQAQVAATATTITAVQCGSTFYNTGAVVITLPTGAAGLLGCRLTFVTMNASNFDVNPGNSDQIMLLTDAAGDAIRNATIGNVVILQYVGTNKWIDISHIGTWSDVN